MEVNMAKKINSLFLSSQGLRHKLWTAFGLMSILPLLVCMYLVSSYILPRMGFRLDIAIVLSISISAFIASIGFILIKQVFDRILSVSGEAKRIVAGDTSRKLETGYKDEVGDLSESLNKLAQRIRSNMDELKNYSEKTTEINLGIQKRIIMLSSLLQITALISQSEKLDNILKLTIQKSRLLANSDVAYLLFAEEGQDVFYMKMVEGANSDYLMKINLAPEKSLFNKALATNKPLILDKQNTLSEGLNKVFYEKLKLKNAVALPLYLSGGAMGILGIGNTRESFLYRKEDIELLDIFAKQIAIAVENDILMHRVEKLEIKDALTGLYNEGFMRNRLQEEIKRAITYQRPCAFITFDIDNFKIFHQNFGSLCAESVLKRIASLIRESVTEIDRVGRTDDDEFSVIVPEKNKRQAQDIAEDIRRKVEFIFGEEKDSNKKITISGGVSENPLDGIDADELITKAKELVAYAKKQGRDRIIGFKEPPVCL
jgi:diguanylate cyclase (GGDEF)-like protein